jgi:cytosine/adenosine deaminase-related metal-dependent hydrolase
MRRLSAQFILTNAGPPLKRGVITTNDDGTIIKVENTNGSLREHQSVEFHNGIIVPGFVNCHCHLELSHLKGAVPEGTGLVEFLIQLQNIRNRNPEAVLSSAVSADKELYNEGIELCADICNTSATFNVKRKSRIRYLNMLEVFGTDPGKADIRMNEIIRLSEDSAKSGLDFFIVPHTVYTVSLPLFRLIREKTGENRITSIHFMETEGEDSFVSDHSGPLKGSFEKAGMLPRELQTSESLTSAILDEVTPSGTLILVHNTYADRKTVREILKRKNTFWCLCPDANLYIENKIPPADMLVSEGCEIVTGTDSLASNGKLSILSGLKTLQCYYPSLGLEELIRWATINGARALGEDRNYGKIEPGKKPGLLLLQNADLVNFRLLPETAVTRLL